MISVSEKEIQFLPRLQSPFSFHCVACGECCGSFTIILSPYDIFRLRKATKLDTRRLLEGGFVNVRRESFQAIFGFAPIANFFGVFGLARNDTVPAAFLQFKRTSRDREVCRFLGEFSEGKRLCQIYENRPTMCRLHPLGCVTVGGRRQWFFRKPKCRGKGGKEQTVEQWIFSSKSRPFLAANVQFLHWMRTFLNPAGLFSSLPEEQKQMAERILYDFDSFSGTRKQMSWRSIGDRFRQWQSELTKKTGVD